MAAEAVAARPCAACGQVNPEIARFCLACGAVIEQDAGRPADERKTVTVLFCDLVGFTAASDRADPEDVRARIRPYHARLRQVAEGFGGTVEKFIGDAVMAVFGAPVAHEDDPIRAVLAALAIRDSIGDELQIRTAVNAKGKSQPVPVWEVVSAHSRLGTDVEHARGTALVGRESELFLLEDSLA